MSRESVKFHIKSKDYFGTLASVLYLIKQDLGENISLINNKNILDNCVNDLMYLQKEYNIVKKSK